MQNLIDRIYYALVWLSRIGKSRGFGVQSPSAYSFIRYVINEHYPYYSYSDLKLRFPALLWKQRKLLELYFRLSNFAQSKHWLTNGIIDDELCAYIKAGCNISELRAESTFDIITDNDIRVVLVRDILSDKLINWFCTEAPNDSFLIFEGIYSSTMKLKQWHQLIEDNRTGCSFDLYYCGILFKDTSKFKQHYCVNF